MTESEAGARRSPGRAFPGRRGEPDQVAEIGVFGGSGFYSLFDDATEHVVDTPYGAPAAPVTVGTIAERRVAFLPRHGKDHQHSPAQVPARANLWAFRSLGVRHVLGPCAAGSLAPHVHPGDFVVLDQLVDRTTGRADTYYDAEVTHHVSFADPYCDRLRAIAVRAAQECAITVHDHGTVVVVQGPRFSTRAESKWYRAQGWEIINMTQYPEAYLARELGLCYCGVALVTDYDTGAVEDPETGPVTQEEVFAFFDSNLHRVRELIAAVVPQIGAGAPACSCKDALGPLAVPQ